MSSRSLRRLAHRPIFEARGRKLLAVCGAVVVTLAASSAFAFFKMSALAASATERALPSISRQLGFEIRIDRVNAHLLPQPSVDLSNLIVLRPGEPAMLTATTVHANVALWPFVLSLGADVQVTTVDIDGARMACVRRADGTWNALSLAAQLLQSPSRPPSTLHVRHAKVRASTVEVYDLGQGLQPIGLLDAVETTIDLNPQATSASVNVGGTVGGSLRNASAALSLALPANSTQAGSFALDVRGTAILDHVDLALARPWVPAALQAVATDGLLSVQATLATTEVGTLSATGHGTLEHVTLLDQPASMTFSVDARLATNAPGNFELDLPSITIDRVSLAKLDLRDLRTQGSLRASTFYAEQGVGTSCGAAGSLVRASVSPGAAWTVGATIEKLSLTELAHTTGLHLPLSGTLTSHVDGIGTGLSWDVVRPTVSGVGHFDVDQAQLSAETVSALVRALGTTLATAGLPSALTGALGAVSGPMPIDPFGAGFRIVEGQVRLTDPITLRTPMVDVILTGHVGLDQTLWLRGRGRLHTGRLGHSSSQGLPVVIRGTLSEPTFEIPASAAEVAAALANAVPSLRDIQDTAQRHLHEWLQRR